MDVFSVQSNGWNLSSPSSSTNVSTLPRLGSINLNCSMKSGHTEAALCSTSVVEILFTMSYAATDRVDCAQRSH